jgi:hypothetical protein
MLIRLIIQAPPAYLSFDAKTPLIICDVNTLEVKFDVKTAEVKLDVAS